MTSRVRKAPRRPCRWRLNGVHHEWLPTDAVPGPRRALPYPIGEIRRKADDRRLAWFGLRDGKRGGTWRIQPLPRADAATRAALRELSQLLRRLGPRGNRAVGPGTKRSRAGRGGRLARLPGLPLPPDYANRTGLPRHAEPALLVDAGRDAFGRRAWLQPAVARDWRRMRAAAAAEGVALQLVSAFRHAAYQTRLFHRKLARGTPLEQILGVNAAPGYSEHHSGRAIDLTTPGSEPAEEAFEGTDAFAWVRRHAARYGFRLSYPRGNPHGVTYEPWHWYHIGAGGERAD